MRKSKVGLYWAIAGLAVYAFLNIFIVFQLPEKMDTFLTFSWVVLPGVAGGLIFQIMDNKGMFQD